MWAQTVLDIDIIFIDYGLSDARQYILFFINIGLSDFLEIIKQQLEILHKQTIIGILTAIKSQIKIRVTYF